MEQQWISVKKRFPVYYTNVIVCPVDNQVLSAFLVDPNTWKADIKDDYYIENVTHWALFTKPPKK